MIYGGKPMKPVPPSKAGVSIPTPFRGPQAYTYGFLAKQPGNDYKIRLRDIERMRTERFRIQNENDFKNILREAQHKEMIDMSDKKCLYNQIKRMVECGMKANEHLFIEECPKPELKLEKEPETPKIVQEDLIEKARKIKEKSDEEERKLVEEKRLQMFIVNSEELRFAAMEKRKNDIAHINYKIIQENDKFIKEQKIKMRELANIENAEIFKKQTLEKEEEKRKLLEKKQQFRKELFEQVQQKELILEQQKVLKAIECNDIKKLNEKLNEEEQFEKLERKKKQLQTKQDIALFTKERANLFSKMNEATAMFDETFKITMKQNLKDDSADEIEAKLQLKRENDLFKEHQAIIKEERKKQSDEISKTIMKQINEIEELKLSIERENTEARRKRMKEGHNVLMEQLKSRKILLEEQKELKREMFKQSIKEYEDYIKEEKLQWENKKQYKWQFRKDLNDQIKSSKELIEKQRQIDLENHQKLMMELAEQEKLLKKLLSEL
ncbi:golgin subfamily A member 6-like protein 22 isoform X1 [Metopolophium dirhodum]|uniref:golgin subfamily A member 6-like protein 22 isoform X1 n=2 Tax=Metopolophium dirhodum TaxID=44670 RepID=UPI00298FD780|nr:golgin subfamily A member 6-like protein 22 isoform X1 [Metopolophium dirhodum]